MSIESRKVIAKNTLMLYFRMAVTLLISLYISRVILDALGFVDYGLYNVVGGVVVMFTFLNGSLSNATQRFLNYGIGKKGTEHINMVFSSSIYIHMVISILILIVAETFGLWFVYNKLVIPEERFETCLWIYQFSIINCIFGIIGAPYQALIISYEKMGAFSYISILEFVLKLGVANMVASSRYDRLFLYAFLLLIVSLLILIIKIGYCRWRVPSAKFIWRVRKQFYYSIGSFSGWSLVGSLALIGINQGVNILINMFYGPAVNAARAIAVQIQAALSGFSRNIQMASNPQIIKNYAAGDLNHMHYLMTKSAKFSFFALFTISLPIMMDMDFLLDIWLKDVPEYTSEFAVLLLIISLLDCTTGPLISSVNATGKIRNYQLTIGMILLSIVPVLYVILKITTISPIFVIVFILFSDIVALIARLLFCKKQIKLDMAKFVKDVYGRILLLVVVTIPFVWFCHHYLSHNIIMVFLSFVISVVLILTAIYFVGMTNGERTTMKRFVMGKVKSQKWGR